jgi:membrane protein YqaA with SNARE-associated domain
MASLTPASEERPGLHYRLYRWVLHWSGHPRAVAALFWLAFAEASFFPIPPDVLLMAMALATPARALRYAAIATTGSVLGGLAGYGIGFGLWRAIEAFAFRHLGFLGFTPELFAIVQQKYQANALLALFTAAFTPIPYKVFTIAAGVFEVGLPVFVVASVLGRGGRFGLVALALRWLGPAVRPFLDRYLGWLTLAFAALLAGGFWLVSRLGQH